MNLSYQLPPREKIIEISSKRMYFRGLLTYSHIVDIVYIYKHMGIQVAWIIVGLTSAKLPAGPLWVYTACHIMERGLESNVLRGFIYC